MDQALMELAAAYLAALTRSKIFSVSPNKINGKETWLQMPVPASGLQKKAYGTVLVENGQDRGLKMS